MNFEFVSSNDFFKLLKRPIKAEADEVVIIGNNDLTLVDEKFILYKLVKIIQPKVILEIGTHLGYTTLGFARNSPRSLIYTIDICQEMNSDMSRLPGAVDPLPKKDVGRAFRCSDLEISQIFGDSRQAETYSFLKNTKIDFTFIDGNHSFEAVVMDTHNVMRHMKKGSIICWHDFKGDSRFEVREALVYLSQRERMKFVSIRRTSLAFSFL